MYNNVLMNAIAGVTSTLRGIDEQQKQASMGANLEKQANVDQFKYLAAVRANELEKYAMIPAGAISNAVHSTPGIMATLLAKAKAAAMANPKMTAGAFGGLAGGIGGGLAADNTLLGAGLGALGGAGLGVGGMAARQTVPGLVNSLGLKLDDAAMSRVMGG